MVAPSAALPVRTNRWRILLGGLGALAAVLVFLAVDTVGRVKHLGDLRALDDIHAASPALTPGGETGYALGERRLVLPAAMIDSYHEIMQTQQMLAGGPWRVREASYDNAPRGREVHWAFPLHGWLGFLAWIRHAVTDRPLGAAVEDAALVANPLLLAIFLLVTVPWISRRFGSTAGALLACGTICCYPFYLNFAAGNAEHQGMAEALAFLTVAFLLAGRAVADRRGFIASAVAGGIGLWISTASEAPVLLAIGVGALLSLWLDRPAGGTPDSRPALPPELWRIWGLVGAGISLAAYVLEYFPSHFGWRFEVNHPVYALVWAAGGEALCRFGRWILAPPGPERRFNLAVAIAAAAAVAGLGAVIALTQRETFWVTDPFLWRLHNDYIAEFQSMKSYLIRRGFDVTAIARVLPLFLPAIALGYGLRRQAGSFLRSQLALGLTPAILACTLAAGQIRWWGLASGLSIASTLPLLGALREPGVARSSRFCWGLACALLLVPGGVGAIRLLSANSAYTQEEVEGLAERDLAHWLRDESGSRPPVVLSTPSFTTGLIFHGGLTGVGTLYWENRAGLRNAAAIFDADTPEQARDLIRAAGVTHIILVTWDPFLGNYLRLARGLTPAVIPAFHSFTACLLGQAPLPAWLHRVPFSLPKHPALAGQSVVIFETDSTAN
jgi:hypothetical protein